MSEITICLKEYLNEEDCKRINELKNICTEKEDIFLKLELDFKLSMKQAYKEDALFNINEFFYYSDQTLIGYLGIFSFGGETGELTGMVHPLYRRKGIFKRLCSLAKEECKRRNFKKVLLVCDNSSSSGLAFLKALDAVYSFSEYEMKMENNYVSEEENSIVLRKAQNSDAYEIERQNNIYFGGISKAVAMPEDEEKSNRITYMVELDSRVIGKIRVEINEERGFLCGFGILPEYRNKGYGKQAFRAALSILNRNNIHNVELEVAAHNKNALNLYKSYGFAEESVTDYYEFLN